MHIQIQKMNQKGFTLIEILAVMAVSSLVIVAVVTSMYQISYGTTRTSNRLTTLNDINNVIPWIKRDIQAAQYTDLTPGGPSQSSLSLYWLDLTFFTIEEDPITHQSEYSLTGTELERTYDGTTNVIGRNITSIGFTQDNYTITCNITSTGPTPGIEHTETITFSILMRSAEVQ
ncbi:type II secretion system protein J [Chloroflexota bacterium]